MSDIDPTPGTPVTIGDRLGWFRSDLDARLAALSLQLATQHAEIMAELTALRGTGPENTLKSLNQSLWNIGGPAPGTNLTELLAALQSGSSGGATEATVTAILDAIGALPTYPADWTVRALLASINQFIDTAPTPGEPPTNPTNPNDTQNADPGGCGSVTWNYSARITNSYLLDHTIIGSVDYGIYAVIIPTVTGYLIGDQQSGVARTDPAYFSTYPTGFLQICLSWDFTNNQIGSSWGRLLSGNPGNAGLATTPFALNSIIGYYSDEMRIGTSTEYISYRFMAPLQYGMPNNTFLHIRGMHPA